MPPYSHATVQKHLDEADSAPTNAAKGKSFEDLICYLFGKIPGLTSPQRNALNQGDSEEIDVAFWNEQHPRGLKSFDAVLLIECKNWSSAVGSIHVSWFLTKIENRGLDFGILVAANGVTGDAEDGKRAHDLISKALIKNIRLIVITRVEIQGLATSEELVELIKVKVCQLVVSGTAWP
jgi:hypothetical protein